MTRAEQLADVRHLFAKHRHRVGVKIGQMTRRMQARPARETVWAYERRGGTFGGISTGKNVIVLPDFAGSGTPGGEGGS